MFQIGDSVRVSNRWSVIRFGQTGRIVDAGTNVNGRYYRVRFADGQTWGYYPDELIASTPGN